MKIVGVKVVHKKGIFGVVAEQNDKRIRVQFEHPVLHGKKVWYYAFPSPVTFRNELSAVDPAVQESILLSDFDGLPFVDCCSVRWWRKGPQDWANLEYAREIHTAFSRELDELYSKKLRDERFTALKLLPVVDLFSKAIEIRKVIKRSQGERRGDRLEAHEVDMSAEGADCLEVAIAKMLGDASLSVDYKASELRYYLPVLSSFYRGSKQSERCYTDILLKYKDFPLPLFGGKLYTSVAAAFCDMGDLEGAEKYYHLAIKHGQSRNSIHLDNVWHRIEAMRLEIEEPLTFSAL